MNDRGSTATGHSTERLQPDPDGIARAARLLQAGRLVAFPTETVYGLGADATNAAAVAGIYGAKERPRFNPLIAHMASLDAALVEGRFDHRARRLAEAFWPGPLTLVVPLAPQSSVADLARAGLDSVGLRIPDHPVARALLETTGRPVAAPSANRSGRVSPTTAAHVLVDLDGRIDAVLDAGPTRVGLESTIVACLGGPARLLRPGGVPRERLEQVLGEAIEADLSASDAPLAPGLLASHYAPRASVRLEATDLRPGEAALLFGAVRPDGLQRATAVENLSSRADLVEAAANLFAALRRLDATGTEAIAVSPIPQTGLGEAINDRLRRAAADRSGAP